MHSYTYHRKVMPLWDNFIKITSTVFTTYLWQGSCLFNRKIHTVGIRKYTKVEINVLLDTHNTQNETNGINY